MPGGGRRTGAGRPRKIGLKNKELYVSFDLDTADKLKSMIPRGHRSEFVNDCVQSALRMRELLNEQYGRRSMTAWESEAAADFFWSEMNEPDTNSSDLPGAHQVPVNNHNIIQ